MGSKIKEFNPMIAIKNIYYMLSYAFRALSKDSYKSLEREKFDNLFDLYAAILIKGISIQLKRGLIKDYIRTEETTPAIKGKIDISKSIKNFTMVNNQMVCQYDDYSANNYMNQILKTTMHLLLKKDIKIKRKNELRKLLLYFSEADLLDARSINWSFRFHRNNQHYELLLSISRLVINGVLQAETKGSHKMMTFMDDQSMNRLYEKFILEYYRKEFPEIEANASQVKWQLDDDYDELLPNMQTDVMLSKGNKILIIDAKYYKNMTQSNFDTNKNHSHNLYQIFTYVKNKEAELKEENYEVSGMVLYAKTDEEVIPDNSYQMSGNRIHMSTLDLNCEFSEIKKQLGEIADTLN